MPDEATSSGPQLPADAVGEVPPSAPVAGMPAPPVATTAAGNPAGTRIHDMPEDERPREKMIARGAAALSDSELLALFFRTGTAGLNAIDVGRAMLKRHGSLTAIGRLHLKELQKQKGVGPAKAVDLCAAFELGRRLARENWTREPLDSPDAVLALVGSDMRREPCEVLKVILVNARLHFTGEEVISRGGINETYAHPREILKHPLLHGSYGFILVHNHPSGDPAPSGADVALTRRVRDSADLMQIRFLDHIVIGVPSAGNPGYYSFREAGII